MISTPAIAAILWAVILGGVGGLVTEIGPWYRALKKPVFQPPDWAFGPAWTIILGLAGWVVSGGAIVLWAANRYGRQPSLVRARLARALATAIEAGLPLARSVRLAAGVAADVDVERHIAAIDERTLGSRSLVATFAGCPHMSPDFMAVLEVAEKTGDFSGSIGRLATLYEDGFR